jgi:hypothetical protein
MSEIRGDPATPANQALPDEIEEMLAEWAFPACRPRTPYLFGLPFDFWAFLRARWGSSADGGPRAER